MYQKSILSLLILAAVSYGQTTQPAELPTRISIKIENQTLEDSLQDLSKTIGAGLQMSDQNRRRNPNQPAPPTNQPINITADNQPVMKVLYDLMQQAQIYPAVNEQPAPATSFDRRKPIRVELINDQMILVINSIDVSGSVGINSSEASFNYQYQGVLLFDPGMKVVATSFNSRVFRLEGTDALLRDGGFGHEQLQRVDGRGLGVHPVTIQMQTNKRLKEIPSISVNLRAYQIVDDKEVQISNTDLLNGGKNEIEGLSISAPPVDPSGQRGISITVSGSALADLRNQYPWQQYFPTFFKILGADGPVTGVICNHESQGNDSSVYRLSRRNVPLTTDEVDSISFHLPTKLKLLNLPVVLNDMPLP